MSKMWIICAIVLVILGVTLFSMALAGYNWDFTKLSTVKYETNTHQINEVFNDISIKTDTSDVVFAASSDGICKVVCDETEKIKHSVTVVDSTLTINLLDERKWYEYIGINFRSTKITVYLPDAEYNKLFIKESTGDIEIPKDFKFESIDISASTGDVKNFASASDLIKIKASTGSIKVEGVSAETLDLSVSTGKITASGINCGHIKTKVSTGKTSLTDISCANVISSGDTGEITLKNVIATEKFSIERSTGNVKFDGCDASEIFVKTDTGDVKGSLLSDKVFITESDTGSINVPKTVAGGRCEITTDTGDIKINIQ
ncbi:MAG: DUF4097 family beta strand repeat protein [Clostridia bacterium]|nr:DUF4097 family beta strand repeat protein [Clostridia bacterium]